MACDLRRPHPSELEHVNKAMAMFTQMDEAELYYFVSQYDERSQWERLPESQRLIVQMARCWTDPAQRESVVEWATEAIVTHETERGIGLIEELLTQEAGEVG